jgi:dTDP-4-dehydrorhamnose reductase
VSGAGGLVGGRLAALLAHTFDVVGGVRHSPAPEGVRGVAFDLLEADSFVKALDAAEPDAVIHCAALADPDRCERETWLAERCNVDAPRRLARLCRQRGVRIISLSTDLVFDGQRSFVTESDAPRPLLAYGRTKLAGEEAVLSEAPGSAVVRVALVVGRGHGERGTASEAIAWALRERRPLRLYTDQHRTPVDSESLADAIARLPEREKLVVALYYYENLTLREIGEVLGVTESRVSQLHTKAVLRLKARLQSEVEE